MKAQINESRNAKKIEEKSHMSRQDLLTSGNISTGRLIPEDLSWRPAHPIVNLTDQQFELISSVVHVHTGLDKEI